MSRFILLFLPILALAADPEDWSRVLNLKSGQSIEVVSMKFKKTEGTFRSSNVDSLQMESAGATISIPRPEIFRISLKENSKRMRNVLLGAAIGAAGGLIIGAAKDASYSEDGEHLAKMLATPVGAGIGAAVGTAFPAFETIYRAPKLPAQTNQPSVNQPVPNGKPH